MVQEINKIEQNVIRQLKEARLSQSMTYETLAQKSGLHRTSISLIERNKTHPTLLVCLKLARALGVDLSGLIELS